MPRSLLSIAALAIAGAAVAAPPPADDRPAEGVLEEIQERGRLIALYREAETKGAALFAKHGAALEPDRTVVLASDRAGWRVVFLKDPSVDGKTVGLRVIAEAEFHPPAGEAGPLRLMAPPRPAPATTASFARALQEAEAAAVGRKEARPPFDAAVFREKNGTFTVYLKGRPPEGAGAQFGGDLMVRIAASGRQMLSVEALHGPAEPTRVAPGPAGQPTLHVHAENDLPLATDVAQVIAVPALAPHLVLTPRFMYRIDAAGRITWLGANRSAPPAGKSP